MALPCVAGREILLATDIHRVVGEHDGDQIASAVVLQVTGPRGAISWYLVTGRIRPVNIEIELGEGEVVSSDGDSVDRDLVHTNGAELSEQVGAIYSWPEVMTLIPHGIPQQEPVRVERTKLFNRGRGGRCRATRRCGGGSGGRRCVGGTVRVIGTVAPISVGIRQCCKLVLVEAARTPKDGVDSVGGQNDSGDSVPLAVETKRNTVAPLTWVHICQMAVIGARCPQSSVESRVLPDHLFG